MIFNEDELLKYMQRGHSVVYRGVTGTAEDEKGRYVSVDALLKLKKKKLIEIDKVDERVLWVWYKAKEQKGK